MQPLLHVLPDGVDMLSNSVELLPYLHMQAQLAHKEATFRTVEVVVVPIRELIYFGFARYPRHDVISTNRTRTHSSIAHGSAYQGGK